MALDFYGIFLIECDSENSGFNEYCWEESLVKIDVENGETKEEAIEFVTRVGWEILEDGSSICPYCSKGVKKNRRLRLVKDGQYPAG